MKLMVKPVNTKKDVRKQLMQEVWFWTPKLVSRAGDCYALIVKFLSLELSLIG